MLSVLKEHIVDERADHSSQGSLNDALTVKRIRQVVEDGSGFESQLAEIESLAAYRGGNWTPLVERFFRPDRPTRPCSSSPARSLSCPPGTAACSTLFSTRSHIGT
ncbi:hypothetical protein ACIHFC_36480 [Streptomyces sp. NPDC052013]|uniref:hypothetical protein n=1 Tax=Streptomyces sp. NPDC052013 TaxID=3365679 RepID=UPI0037D23C7A